MTRDTKKTGFFKKFPAQFWLVIIFEFFERGAYYGMMSFLAVYFTDTLGFAKEGVGTIKGVIQPLLYFLPILAGAIADRFGYRRMLMAAFTLLGAGYFLTSQMTTYTGVFISLVVMGVGAGTFKPIISGTIARITDESNSTQAFGIFYWSINMGAFLFPLVLVPMLKKLDPSYVIIASGICTAAMLIPTAFFFKDPGQRSAADAKATERNRVSLLQTLANAFEIIYSPIVLLYNLAKKSTVWKTAILTLLMLFLVFAAISYWSNPSETGEFSPVGIARADVTVITSISRHMGKPFAFDFAPDPKNPAYYHFTVYKPDNIHAEMDGLLTRLKNVPALQDVSGEDVAEWIRLSMCKAYIRLDPPQTGTLNEDFRVIRVDGNHFVIHWRSGKSFAELEKRLLAELHKTPLLRGIGIKELRTLNDKLSGRPVFLLYIGVTALVGLLLVWLSSALPEDGKTTVLPTGRKSAAFLAVFAVIVALSLAPGVTLLERIIYSVIFFSLLSLLIIDKGNPARFADHGRFLLMIILYSGFWVLYFQMFDSVLWYVQAYVDAGALNRFVNAIPALVGIKTQWFFDVEHVTVVNALAIILLQLLISSIVKNKKALPTMIVGIAAATIGMAILAVSTHIMVFLAGIIIFSIGEMTAHPKFISYVGLTAPAEKKAMYMGYIFLYGVFGSSVGSILGARLYVRFVENLNQPRTLWLIFSGIGVATITGLLLFNRFLTGKK